MLALWGSRLQKDRCCEIWLVLVALELLLMLDLCSMSFTRFSPPAYLTHLSQSPLDTPKYLTDCGAPHEYGVAVETPPVCSRCSEDPDSAPKLEQHVRVSKVPSFEIKVPNPLANQAGMISLSDPLNAISHMTFNSKHLSLLTPSWMSLLPSGDKPFGVKLRRSVTRRSTYPEYAAAQSPVLSINQFEASSHTNSQEVLTRKSSRPVRASGPSYLSTVKSLEATVLEDHGLRKRLMPPRERDTGGAPRALGATEHLSLVPDTELCGRSPDQHVPDGNDVECGAAEDKQERNVHQSTRHSFSQQLFSRSNSLQRRFSLGKPRSPSTITTAGSCGSAKSHSLVPSQDISPAKTPLLKELSSFFATRAGK